MCNWNHAKPLWSDTDLCESESTHRVTHRLRDKLPGGLVYGDTVCDQHSRALASGDFDTEEL